MKCLYPAVLLILASACSSHSPSQANKTSTTSLGSVHNLLPPNTIVAADSMPFGEDQLNHFYFSVVIKVSEDNSKPNASGATYDVLAGYGPARSTGHIYMPRHAENLTPLLRRDTAEQYAYIIGFIPGKEVGGDSAFHEFYKVSASHGEIIIKQLKGYTFD